jgi:energy-converting hydrogenase Eha subunit G
VFGAITESREINELSLEIRMFRTLPTIVAITLIAASGLIQRFWIGRGSDEDVLRAAASRLSLIPIDAGDWEGHALKMNQREFKQTEANCVLQRS